MLAIAAGTGDVLMSRLREGRANTAWGAAHFLRETVGRVRFGGGETCKTLVLGRRALMFRFGWRLGRREGQGECPIPV